jgi:Recombination directionality factor-like
MGIKNTTPRLAEWGKIKIGAKGEMKTSNQGKQFAQPQKLDHFIITTMERDAAGRLLPDGDLMARLKPEGDKITSIPILLLYDDSEVNFLTRYAAYVGNTLWCQGDGESAQRLQDGKYQTVTCPCPRLEEAYGGKDICKPNGVLQCLIQGVNRIGGVWKFRTTSWNSVQSIMSSMKLFQTITGGILAGIPLQMRVSPKTVNVRGSNQVVYVVSLEFSGTTQELTQVALDITRRQAEYRVRLEHLEAEARKAWEHQEESPEEVKDIQQEFYPEGVVLNVSPEEIIPPGTQPEAEKEAEPGATTGFSATETAPFLAEAPETAVGKGNGNGRPQSAELF